MSFKYVKKLGLKIWKTNIRAQKIDEFILKIFEMLSTNF